MDHYVGNQIITAIGRQRRMAEAAHIRVSDLSNVDELEETEMATGARNLLGRALARAGRTLRLGSAPRPEPLPK